MEWYAKNRDKVLQQKRDQYQNDTAFREAKRQYALAYYHLTKMQPNKRKPKKPEPPLVRIEDGEVVRYT
jgi:hypothetical protein